MSDSRPAWAEFFEFMQRLDAEYLSVDRGISSAADVAEGEHMLLHLLKAGLDVFVDNDPGRPRFAPLAGPTLKWGGEGADNPSHCAPLDPDRRYRIRGNVGTAQYVSFTVYKGKEQGDWNDGVISALNHREFGVATDGSFEIEIGSEPGPGVLHMEAGVANCVIARHYFEAEVCAMANPDLHIELSIEALEDPLFPRPIAPAALSARLRAAMTFIEGQTLARPPMGQGAPPAWFSLVPNQLPQPLQWEPSEGGGAGAVAPGGVATLGRQDLAALPQARRPGGGARRHRAEPQLPAPALRRLLSDRHRADEPRVSCGAAAPPDRVEPLRAVQPVRRGLPHRRDQERRRV